jgi:hypothetical protein
MLTNKRYELQCDDCNHSAEKGSPDPECPKCGGFMRIISRHGKCKCGATVEFGHFTNTCDKCDRDYNSSGQELAHRSQWGEETGESLSDILRIR